MSEQEPTHYDVLDVTTEATTEIIRRAYRIRAKESHPDAGGDPATFRRVLEAYQTLTNPLLRREYDDLLAIRRGFTTTSTASGGAATSWRTEAQEAAGWSGADGAFTGDVEFPSWLRDVTDQQWVPGDPQAGRAAAPEPEHVRPADVLWWWTERSVVAPVLAGQVVITGTDDAVVALDGFNGREAWRAGVRTGLVVPVVVVGDTVVCWTEDGLLHGLELGRGVTRWELALPTPSVGGLTMVNGLAVAALEDHLLAVDPRDGSVRWRSDLAARPTVPTVEVNGLIIAGTQKGVEAIDAKKGRARWRAPSRYPVDLPLCATPTGVWVSVSAGAQLHRLDLATGAGAGSWDARSTIAGLASAGNVLYASVVGPTQLVAVDPTGFVRWATSLTAASPEPALIVGTAYVAETSNRITVIETVDGTHVTARSLPFEPFGPPIGFVDRLILQERHGRVWCIDAPG